MNLKSMLLYSKKYDGAEQLDEMGMREISSVSKKFIGAADRAVRSGNVAEARKNIRLAAKNYISRMAKYYGIEGTEKEVQVKAGEKAFNGWAKTANNPKVQKVFTIGDGKNKEKLMSMFKDVLATKKTFMVGDKISSGSKKTKVKKKEDSRTSTEQRRIKKGIEKSIRKKDKERIELLNQVKIANPTELKNIAKNVLKDWKKTPETKESKLDIIVLQNLINKGGESVPSYVEKARGVLINSLRQGKIALETVLNLLYLPRSGRKTMKSNLIKKTKNENYFEKETLLADSCGYKGVYFLENYVMSNILRTFSKDVIEYGAGRAAAMYVDLYGEETKPIFVYMARNEEMLHEAAKIEGKILFEETGYNNATKYLKEQGVAEKIGKAVTAGKGIVGKVVGFLKGAWEKIKAFGKPIIDKVAGFVRKGIPWARELIKKGVAFITTNPIAKIAVPAVAIAGGVVGGIALINRIRKKAKMRKLSDQEKEDLRVMVQKKDSEIEKLKEKGVKIEEF